MIYDIITIGGAVRDFTFYVEKFQRKNSETICFPLGTKINIKEAYFTHGGGACNVAVGLANFGLKVATVIRIGKDHSGQAILEKLKEKKIETRFIQVDERLHTGVSVIIQPKGGERTIFSYRGANDNLKVPNNLQILSSKWVYIASLSGDWENVLNKVFQIWQKSKIAWNPGVLQLQAGKKKLAKFLKRTEVLILNRAESAILAKRSQGNIVQLLKSIYQLGPKIVVVTCGKHGAYIIDKNGILYSRAKMIKNIIDTTGAGDAFSSGFLAGLILFNDTKKALKLGILNSASVLIKVGAQRGLLTKKDLKN
jgi:sugar/nucleoside kinase (ribokinase family)